MSFDGVFTHVICQELATTLVSGRVSKIHQPYEQEIVLVIRQKGKNHKLLLSVHPSYARIQLTTMTYNNPDTPPNFVMMLRKFLDGAILEEMKQIENDRVVHFHFSKRNELGDLQNIILIVELMGRHSNILLVNKESGKILDAIKHVGHSQNTYRTLLPGAEYVEPPLQEKKNPFKLNQEQVFQLLSTLPAMTGSALQQIFQGLGSDTANELAEQLQQHPNQKMATWSRFWTSITETPEPTLTLVGNKEFFTPIPYLSLQGKNTTFNSFNELLDAVYSDKAERDRVKQQGGELIKRIENERKRTVSKLAKRQQTLKDSENAEIYRRNGELLTTFMQQVPRGATSVELPNYYEENQPVVIQLQPELTPNQNAQKYFQKYQKLRNAVKLIYQQIDEAQAEISYLDSVLSQLEIASPVDIEVIKEELIAEGYVKKPTKKRARQEKKSQPERFLASDGTLLLVGRNNLQNDQLTLKTARKTDYWLHAKNIPGSHVIVKSDHPSEATLLEAAGLAAYYSKYRHSAQVPVDYVQVKHIRKPNGAKPGYVIYENQKTLYVTPDETQIMAMDQA